MRFFGEVHEISSIKLHAVARIVKWLLKEITERTGGGYKVYVLLCNLFPNKYMTLLGVLVGHFLQGFCKNSNKDKVWK